jgi:hypothetical protein
VGEDHVFALAARFARKLNDTLSGGDE